MNKVILLFVFTVLYSVSHAQVGDTITIQHDGSTRFFMDGKILTLKDVHRIAAVDRNTKALIKQSKANFDAAQVFGFIGGGLIGWPLGAAAGGGEPAWELAGIGAGLILVAIPFNSAANRHGRAAARAYNEFVRGQALTDTTRRPLHYELAFTPTGVGLRLSF